MAPIHPLEIQEIADLVISYLGSKDVTTCICVSKSWRDMFLSHRWRIVRAGYKVDTNGDTIPLGPEQDAIYNHRHLVHDLTLCKQINGYTEHHYPNLCRLEIDMRESSSDDGSFSMDLTTNTPMLVDLKLNFVKVPSIFWEKLSTHPSLRRLYLGYISIKLDDSARLWRTCMRLESLHMNFVFMDDVQARPRNLVFDRLRELRIGIIALLEGTCHMDLVLQSPMLESFELKISTFEGGGCGIRGYDLGDYGIIKGSTVNGDWPRLKNLHIAGGYEDTGLTFIFERVGSRPGATVDLEPYHSGLGTLSSMDFGSHFRTLVDVDLLGSVVISSSTLPDILCFCPRLEVLRARNALARSVAERGAWVCQQLRELRIQFLFEASEQDLKQLMFERLSTLVRLERLALNYDIPHRGSHYDVLECRLDCGLGQLASLQQLTSLWLCTSSSSKRNPSLGMEEVEWILKNWRRLEKIKGNLNTEGDLGTQLRSMFESHGISVEI